MRRERVVAGALIEDPAWLRDESFDLDLIGFAATDLEPLLARADGEAVWCCPPVAAVARAFN